MKWAIDHITIYVILRLFGMKIISLLAFRVNINRYLSKYWSTLREQEIEQVIGIRLQTSILEALRKIYIKTLFKALF